jgi:integrase-like protein
LVFPGPTGGYLDASALRRRFIKARDAAGLRPLRFHDLRHCFGSLAIRKADIVKVQSWMGHSNIKTTMRYLHHKSRIEDAKILDSAFALDSPPSENGDDPDDDVVARLQRQVAEMAETLAAMRVGT